MEGGSLIPGRSEVEADRGERERPETTEAAVRVAALRPSRRGTCWMWRSQAGVDTPGLRLVGPVGCAVLPHSQKLEDSLW